MNAAEWGTIWLLARVALGIALLLFIWRYDLDKNTKQSGLVLMAGAIAWIAGALGELVYTSASTVWLGRFGIAVMAIAVCRWVKLTHDIQKRLGLL